MEAMAIATQSIRDDNLCEDNRGDGRRRRRRRRGRRRRRRRRR